MAQEVARKIGAEIGQLPNPVIIAQALVCFYLGDWDKAGAELLKCLESGKQTDMVAVTQAASCSAPARCIARYSVALLLLKVPYSGAMSHAPCRALR